MEKKTVGYIGIFIAVIMFCFGVSTKVPQKYISYYGYEEYVGGDAYNIQIEASLRGGEIAGARAEKAIYISSAAIILIFSLSLIARPKKDLPVSTTPLGRNGDVPQEKDAITAQNQENQEIEDVAVSINQENEQEKDISTSNDQENKQEKDITISQNKESGD